MEQMHIFDYLRMLFKITNKIRLIELFAGNSIVKNVLMAIFGQIIGE